VNTGTNKRGFLRGLCGSAVKVNNFVPPLNHSSLTKDKVMELKMFVNIEDLFYNDIEDNC
jgi:hypothetical protein